MNIPFTKFNRPALLFSACMLVIAIGTLFLKGLNLGLDFTGGVSVELKYESKADLEKIRGSLNEIDGANFVVLNFGSDEDVLIKFQSDESLNLNAETVIAKLQEDNYLGSINFFPLGFLKTLHFIKSTTTNYPKLSFFHYLIINAFLLELEA